MNNKYLTRTISVIAIEFQATWGHDISSILRFVGECIESNIQNYTITVSIDHNSNITIDYKNWCITLELGKWLVFDGNNFAVYSNKEFDEKFEKAI